MNPQVTCPAHGCRLPSVQRGNGKAAVSSLLLLFLCGALCGPSAAAPAVGPTRAVPAIEQAVLAEQLTSHALAQPDVLTLVMAARLSTRSAGTPVARKPLASATNPAPPPAKPGPHPRSAAALLARARALAQGRADLLALIEDAAVERARGIEDGPKTSNGMAGARATVMYRERFKASERATVMISGDGDSNLDLYVYDERGARVCAAERLDDVEVCRWQPQGAGQYTIHVVNRGAVENSYVMRSN